MLARDNEEVDDGWLCDKGRFGYQSFRADERITAPMARIGGFLRETTWERALSEAAALLEKSGASTVARVGGQATNEEGFLVQHLMRQGLGSQESRWAAPRRRRRGPPRARARARGSVGAGLGHRPRGRDPRDRHRAGRRGADPRPARAQGRAAQRRAARGGVEPAVDARRRRLGRASLRARRGRGGARRARRRAQLATRAGARSTISRGARARRRASSPAARGMATRPAARTPCAPPRRSCAMRAMS